MAQAAENREQQEGSCRKPELGCCRKRGTKAPLWLAHRSHRAREAVANGSLTRLSSVGSPFVAHTCYKGSVLLFPQTIIPQPSCTSPLWNSGYSPTLPAHPSTSPHSLQPSPGCDTSHERRLRASFSWSQAEVAGDVLPSVAAVIKLVVCNLLRQKMFVQNTIQWDRDAIR